MTVVHGKRRLIVGVTLVGLTVLSTAPSASAAGDTNGKFRAAAQNAIADSYLVVLNDASADRPARLVAKYGGSVQHVYRAALTGFAVTMPANAARALSADPAVAYVQQDTAVQLFDIQPNPPSWGLDRIDQPALPTNSAYTYPSSGAGVHVYMIDSGVLPTHAEFGGRATADADFVNDGRNGVDCDGHGTHVAGIVGGLTFGVAKNARLHGVRVASCSRSSSAARIIAGFDWVVSNAQRPAVINASLGITGSTEIGTAATRAIDAGIPVVAAAGNSDADACRVFPAGVATLTVANSTEADARDTSSNFGTCVHLYAPGNNIVSADIASDTASRARTGTSMAAPHVAGAVALYLGRNPSATPAQVRTAIVNDAITGVISNPGVTTPNRLLFVGNDGFSSRAGDFNGDGLDDIIEFTRGAQADANVALSTGSGFLTKARWHDFFAPETEVPLVGDFNGDDRDDIVTFTRGSVADVFVALSNGLSFVGNGVRWHSSFGTGSDIPAVGDFNGDGRDDIAIFTRGSTADVFVALSNGSSFGARTRWHSSFAFGWELPFVGDFDGDGRSDIATFTRGSSGDVFVALSNGSSFVGNGVKWHGSFGLRAEVPAVGDFNRDGRDDIASFSRGDTADVFVALSNGSSFIGDAVKWHDSFAFGAEVPATGDFNGDGRDDVATFTRGGTGRVFVALSNGSSFVGNGVLWYPTGFAFIMVLGGRIIGRIPAPGVMW